MFINWCQSINFISHHSCLTFFYKIHNNSGVDGGASCASGGGGVCTCVYEVGVKLMSVSSVF